MKKMLLATALALLITGCAQQTFTVQNKPAAVAPKETITHHFFVSGIGQKKLSMQPKFVAAQKMLLKNRNPANIRNGLLSGFITLAFTLLEARVLLTIIVRVAYRYGQQLYLHCSLIYFWVPSSCFCIVTGLLSEGEIIPFSGVCQSGEAALSTPEAVVASRTD